MTTPDTAPINMTRELADLLGMTAPSIYNDGEVVEVETPVGWQPGIYVCKVRDGKHRIECGAIWYGPIAYTDAELAKHVRRPETSS